MGFPTTRDRVDKDTGDTVPAPANGALLQVVRRPQEMIG